MMADSVKLSQKLIRCKSVTPDDGGAIDLIADYLEEIGFTNHKLKFHDTINLYSKIEFGKGGRNLCFAGHVDVVPEGDLTKWKFPPYDAVIDNGILYGRGAVDMKAAIACFIAAASRYLAIHKSNGNISLLLTSDEEGSAENGTIKVLEWLKNSSEKISHAIVGEPTNANSLSEIVKIGRRGSVNFTLTVNGKQGHVAYSENAINPIAKMVEILERIRNIKFDDGNEFFQPSNLEITNIEVGNKTTNVIPEKAIANFNVRFNSMHKGEDIVRTIKNHTENHDLQYKISGESFLTKKGEFSDIVSRAIYNVSGKIPVFSTTGGTSDARFIKDYCEVLEYGMINKTAHQIDEHVEIKDIEKLTKEYLEIIKLYFDA